MNRLYILVFLAIVTLTLSSCSSKIEIVFVSNEGTPIETLYTNPDYYLDKSIIPEKQGYTFVGWYFDPVYALRCDADDTINVDTTLYAKWDINHYTITLDISKYDDSDEIFTLRRMYKTAGPIPAIEIDGFDFVGWYINENLTEEYDNTTKTIEDYTVYGKYEESK